MARAGSSAGEKGAARSSRASVPALTSAGRRSSACSVLPPTATAATPVVAQSATRRPAASSRRFISRTTCDLPVPAAPVSRMDLPSSTARRMAASCAAETAMGAPAPAASSGGAGAAPPRSGETAGAGAERRRCSTHRLRCAAAALALRRPSAPPPPYPKTRLFHCPRVRRERRKRQGMHGSAALAQRKVIVRMRQHVFAMAHNTLKYIKKK